jgi:HAD superfamily hydrolase (TIGR01509 family)
MSIACILFDLGNVLLLHHSQRRLKAIAEFSGCAEKDVADFLSASGIIERLDTGEASEADLCAALGELAGKPLSPNEAVALWLTVFEPNRELWDALPRLAVRQQLGVFSNNPPFIRQLFAPGVNFKHIFLSAQFGIMKPDIRVFETVQAELDLAPGEVVFIADKSDNVAQARSIGWAAIQFRSNAELGQELARLGLREPGLW